MEKTLFKIQKTTPQIDANGKSYKNRKIIMNRKNWIEKSDPRIQKQYVKMFGCCNRKEESEIKVFEAQFQILPFSWKIHDPVLKYSIYSVLNHSIKFKSFDVMFSISALGRVHLEVVVLRCSLKLQFWKISQYRETTPVCIGVSF